MRPRTLLADTLPDVFAEALAVVDRPEYALAALGSSSNLKVVWECRACRHTWTTSPAARSRGTGCPACAVGKRGTSRARAPQGKSLADLYPQVAGEFVSNASRPGLGPLELRCGSEQRCIWRCSACDHEWVAAVVDRRNGRGCPSCANAKRAIRRRTVIDGNSAALRAPHLVDELVSNLTSPGSGLESRRPASVDRCLWRCSECAYEWQATIVNRVSKNSGCPRCARERNRAARLTPKPGRSLSDTHPHIAAQLVYTVSPLDMDGAQLSNGSNVMCRWRCNRGHEWQTTVAARTYNNSGCPRCRGFGRSRFELEVAELLSLGGQLTVEVDVETVAGGRRWRVDLHIVELSLYIDLDPARWHSDTERDARKVAAMKEADYLRVRPASLRKVAGQVCYVHGNDDGTDPLSWAAAIGSWLARREVAWRKPGPDAVGASLNAAARKWIEVAVARPRYSALDAAPHLAGEFIENLSRPDIDLQWLSPSSKDQVSWHCSTCDWAWTTSVASRAAAKSGCPRCATRRISLRRSAAKPGRSLAELYPAISAEFVTCLRDPARTPNDLSPSSNYLCSWRCDSCGHQWESKPAARIRGRGCVVCHREKARNARSKAPTEKSLVKVNPSLAEEFIDCIDAPERTPHDLYANSNKKCRWRCKCGNEWVTTVASRISGTGCALCGRLRTAEARASARPGGSLADLFPALSAEVIENVTQPQRDPRGLKPGSHSRCRWRCSTCSHEWVTSVKNRTRNGTGCPSCYRHRSRSGGHVNESAS
ncbi:zinc-ribbon domain-containing protein [Streptomyces violens]|uniref:zinc-ribbon domain-containing protein n=1 Tax=Streptomyces violens TaxID=66377 RepID=UPI0012FF0562